MIHFPRFKVRDAVLLAAVAAMTGCGCTDDSFLGGGPLLQPPAFAAGVEVCPVAVPRPPKRVDVVFLIDDSTSYSDGFLAGDGRSKAAVLQDIYRNIVASLQGDLSTAFPTDTWDLAFGVARYEDFGGTFQNALGDEVARPFTLQQALLRQNRADFAANFDAGFNNAAGALGRKLPGTGNRLPVAGAGFSPDASTGIEALYQAAAGTGMDGNGNGSNTESGVAGALATQLTPGPSGDVPAPTFVPAVNDPDGQPAFTVGGAPASGNIGGMGWRPDSLRYIIIGTDWKSVAPFDGAVPATVGNTASPIRPQRDIVTPVFASFLPGDPRFGTGASVAPSTRHTVQNAIDALNDLNIEVLAIDTQTVAGRGGKPNQPGGVTVLPAGPVAAIPNPTQPDQGPFTWTSAMALLTGAIDTDFPVAADNMPLVYNLLTVYPGGAPNPTNDVREDIVDRVGVAKTAIVLPPLPDLTRALTLDVQTAGSGFFVQSIDGQAPTPNPVPGATQTIAVKQYYVGDPAPACTEVRWLVQVSPLDPNAVPPVIGTMGISAAIDVATPGFTNPVGTVEGVATDPAVQPARAQLRSVTAGCLYFAPQSPTVADPAYVVGYHCAPFVF